MADLTTTIAGGPAAPNPAPLASGAWGYGREAEFTRVRSRGR